MPNMIIDFDDIKTYPELIVNHAKFNNYDDYNLVDFNIPIPKDLEKALDNCKFVVYHCTRTTNIDNFKKYGILLPSNPILRKILLKDTEGCDLNDIKEFSLGRGSDIQYVFSLENICNDKQYLNFFEKIGGEIIEFTKDYNLLKCEKGNCFIIKFLINSNEVMFKKFLIQKMIRKLKYNIPVDYSNNVTYEIRPEQILEYILANEIAKKLKEMN